MKDFIHANLLYIPGTRLIKELFSMIIYYKMGSATTNKNNACTPLHYCPCTYEVYCVQNECEQLAIYHSHDFNWICTQTGDFIILIFFIPKEEFGGYCLVQRRSF